jgi:hypothetical protein
MPSHSDGGGLAVGVPTVKACSKLFRSRLSVRESGGSLDWFSSASERVDHIGGTYRWKVS